MSRCGECIHGERCSVFRIIILGDKAQKRCKHFTAASDFVRTEDAKKESAEWRAKYIKAAEDRFLAEQSYRLARDEAVQKQHESETLLKDVFCDIDRAFLRAWDKHEKGGAKVECLSKGIEDTTQAMNCKARAVINELWGDVIEIKCKYRRICETEGNSNGL